MGGSANAVAERSRKALTRPSPGPWLNDLPRAAKGLCKHHTRHLLLAAEITCLFPLLGFPSPTASNRRKVGLAGSHPFCSELWCSGCTGG